MRTRLNSMRNDDMFAVMTFREILPSTVAQQQNFNGMLAEHHENLMNEEVFVGFRFAGTVTTEINMTIIPA